MNRIKPVAIAAAIVAALALAGCDDPKQAQAPSQPAPAQPAPAEPAPQATPPADDGKSATETAKEGLGKLREAAEKAAKDLQPTIDKARETAEQAMKDAQPAIDKAKEAAKQIGQSIDDIVKKAQEDLNSATKALEDRLNEAGNKPPAPVGGPENALAPADKLRADTRAAARAGQASVGPAYVGVWAGKASDCAQIDQGAVEMMAVITPTTIRRYEAVCNIPETVMTDGKATVQAQCVSEGEVEERQISFSMATPDKLTIATGTTPGGEAELLRCHLP